jgi:hypothetical protein
MLTLLQAQQLSQPKLTKSVIDQFRTSPILDQLIFDNTIKAAGGNSLDYVYNRIQTYTGAASRALDVDYVASEAVTQAIMSRLAIFGGRFQIDRALIQGEHEVVDHIQFQVAQKTKATIAQFHNMFINGNRLNPVVGNSFEFDGLDVLLTGSPTQEITPVAPILLNTSANISLNWQEFLDQLRALEAVMDGAPSLYIMNQAMYARFQSVMDRAGINLASKENYGRNVSVWGESLVVAMGNRPGNTAPIIASPAGVTSIYAVRLGLDGVHGTSLSGTKLANVYLPDMNDSAVLKTGSVEMIAGLAYKSTESAAVLRNITIA